MKKYILPGALIILGIGSYWYAKNNSGQGINPIGGIIKYGGILLIIVGIIIGIIRYNKN